MQIEIDPGTVGMGAVAFLLRDWLFEEKHRRRLVLPNPHRCKQLGDALMVVRLSEAKR